MKARHLFVLVAGLWLGGGAAEPDEQRAEHKIEPRSAFTYAEFSNMVFYSEHAAAAYCNSEASYGQPVRCSSSACPSIEKNRATVVASFTQVDILPLHTALSLPAPSPVPCSTASEARG
ncbi:hypothetical protein CDD83_10636 [Cordyceps sp. RAO-2017]|nr:hypothetical protein CDD83_10636 [Cordyceps sp. RAO-2017]